MMGRDITRARPPSNFGDPSRAGHGLSAAVLFAGLQAHCISVEADEETGYSSSVLQGICGVDGVGGQGSGVLSHASRYGARTFWALLRRKRLGAHTGCLDFQKQT